MADELNDFMDALETELKTWNNTALVSGGAGNLFGASGSERIYSEVSSIFAQDDGEVLPNVEEPVIVCAWLDRSNTLFRDTRVVQTSANVQKQDMPFRASVLMAWTGKGDVFTRDARTYVGSAAIWIEEHGINSWADIFVSCENVAPLLSEVVMIATGVVQVGFNVMAVRQVTRTNDY